MAASFKSMFCTANLRRIRGCWRSSPYGPSASICVGFTDFVITQWCSLKCLDKRVLRMRDRKILQRTFVAQWFSKCSHIATSKGFQVPFLGLFLKSSSSSAWVTCGFSVAFLTMSIVSSAILPSASHGTCMQSASSWV